MSQLSRMAQPLLERPLMAAPPIEHLQERTRRRYRHRAMGVSFVGVVMAIALVVALLPASGMHPTNSTLTAYIQKGVSVPDSVLEQVGLPQLVTQAPSSLPEQPRLTEDGKAAVIYIGAEYCPYCAMDRWALIVALSRFGTFSHLGQTISSSSTDVYPGLQSWSFRGSTFQSPSITFDPAEVFSSIPSGDGNGYTQLQRMSAKQDTVYDTYDHTGRGGGYPFLDIGNRYFSIGSMASPAVLIGLSLDQIAGDLSDPTSPVAQAIDGTANYIIGAICVASGDHAPICQSPVMKEAQRLMDARAFVPGQP